MFEKYERVLVRDERHHAWLPALYDREASDPTYPHKIYTGRYSVGQHYRFCIKWDDAKVDQVTD